MLFIPKQFRKVQSIHMLFYRHDMYYHITQASPKTCSNALNTFDLIKIQPIIYQNRLANAIFPLVCALLFFHVTWTQIWMMHCFNFNQQVQLTMTPWSYLIPYKPLTQCWMELYSCRSHAGMLGLRLVLSIVDARNQHPHKEVDRHKIFYVFWKYKNINLKCI